MTGFDEEARGHRIAHMWAEQIRQARHGVGPDREEAQRIIDDCFRDRPCRDCGAEIGSPHDHGCDVERCQYTGMQWIGCGGMTEFKECDCEAVLGSAGKELNYAEDHVCGQVPHDCGSEIWDGIWPGYEAAVEFGWYSLFVPALGWARCGPEWPGASPDLNRIHSECIWDREGARWVKW